MSGNATTLHVEVRMNPLFRETPIHDTITAWLRSEFLRLFLGQVIESFSGLDCAACVQRLEIVDFTGTPAESIQAGWSVRDVAFQLFPYSLRDDLVETESTAPANGDTEENMSCRVSLLPLSQFEEQWSSLVFDPPLAQPLVRFLRRMMVMAKRPGLNASKMNFSKVILFYGPPGTGKSTICRGLAQKLTIRLASVYSYGKLVEISGQSLLSKYFSESGRLVKRMFDHIEELAKDANVLICVLVDEVETITGSREKSLNSNECSDALRATNQLLTALDRLRNLPNVVVFCTSNLLTTIDSAFLDRIDLKQFIQNPGPAARYDILRSCLNELLGSGIIDPRYAIKDTREMIERFRDEDDEMGIFNEDEFVELLGLGSKLLKDSHYAQATYADTSTTMESKVWALAVHAEGLSGRTLRRMPFISIALHLSEDTCSLSQAVNALALTVEEELRLQQRTGVTGTRDSREKARELVL